MNLYKTILNNLPTAAIVVDKNLKVRYASRAFRDYFPRSKGKGTLKDAIGCTETGVCGREQKCAFCPMLSLFSEAVAGKGLAFRLVVLRNAEGENVPLRIKVQPLGKFYLGVVDNSYETEIAREMYSAQSIQQRLLPPATPFGGVPYSFMFEPCREIGGDLPDVYLQDGCTMGLLADVSGKGISAGMLSAFVKAGWDRSEPSPAKALRGLSAKYRELNLDERSYITAAAVRIEEAEKRIRYCVAGHNAPILLKSGAGIDEIVMSAPPVSNWIPDFGYEDRTISYRRGDILVLLTDGVSESRNERGEQFGLERAENILQHSPNAERFIERLKAALIDFCGAFDDDVTAIAFDL